ncbi:MAG: outer membrane protein assembly factor BamA [Melioribacteraceae bacterium]|nr:outer membrane protein assembly factor BamA [Melioribacteraceae bacterium]
MGISVLGNKTADASTIIANSGLKVGGEIEIPGDQTLNAIKRLWALGIFKPNIEIVVEKKIDNGVFLQINLEEFPRIEKCIIIGNDEIDEDEIQKKISFTTGQILKSQEIYRVKNKIKSLYDEEGYLNAEIEPKLYSFFKADTSDDEITVTWRYENDWSDEYETVYDYEPESRIDIINKIDQRKLLIYEIDEGDEVIVQQIRFNGNEAFDDDDLKSEFEETVEDAWWRFFSSANLNREEYEKDKELITNFYRKNGYRDFQILNDSLIYSSDNNYVDIVLNVYEGPQYIIRNIVWEGNTVYDDETLNQRLNFRRGDIYDYERFNQNLRFNEKQTDVSSLYQDNGYLGFNLDAKEERIGNDSLDIIIRVMENNRFKIGKIDISGNTRTKDNVIRRELYTVPGDYFSRQNTISSIQQLANLQYFNVEKLYQNGVEPRPVNDSTVNISYNVEEKSSDYLNASVGYSGAFGFSGAVGVTLTNFSITEPFQMGGGQILNFNWQFGVGNFYRTFSLGFTEPWFLDTPTSVGFDLFDTRQRYVYDLRQSGITLRVGRRLTWPDRYFYVQAMGRFQYNDVIDGRNFYTEGLSRQYTVGTTISRNDIDNPIFPSRGSKISFNAELSGGPFLPGNVDYYKLDFTADFYRRLLNSNRLALYAGVSMGFLDELTAGTLIQPFEFYFMGGNGLVIATSPLRGYDDRSVGPKSDSGFELGGRVMTKYTLELRAALALEPMPIYVLAFAEAGNVYRNLSNTDLFDLKRSAGVGARLLVNPIGLIGFDFGYGFDRMSVNGKNPEWLFHFQFGRGF